MKNNRHSLVSAGVLIVTSDKTTKIKSAKPG